MNFTYYKFLVISIFVFLSCGKGADQDIDESVEIENLITEDFSDKEGCFELIYPVGLLFPDGNERRVENGEQLIEALKNWFENHDDQREKPAFIYPIDVVIEDDDEDKIVSILSDEEFVKLKKYCEEEDRVDWEDKDDCFEWVYPVSYELPDGSVISGDERELDAAIEEWYKANQDSDREPQLQFPIQIKFEDRDDLVTVNNKEELERWEAACKDEEGDREDCFELIYPVSYTLPNGSVVTGGPEELERMIKEWYDNHPDVDRRPTLVFPVDIKLKDGEVLTINNEEGLDRIKEGC